MCVLSMGEKGGRNLQRRKKSNEVEDLSMLISFTVEVRILSILSEPKRSATFLQPIGVSILLDYSIAIQRLISAHRKLAVLQRTDLRSVQCWSRCTNASSRKA